ncbi:MAG: hypothetical protein HOI66_14195, partial [Verrucomicrobia bacterium]|nr:hypothetical protein [Verrucomicrobiota bacterium]
MKRWRLKQQATWFFSCGVMVLSLFLDGLAFAQNLPSDAPTVTLDELLRAAETADPVAEFNLGLAYFNGSV